MTRYTPPTRRQERRHVRDSARALGCVCTPDVAHVGPHHWRLEHDPRCPLRGRAYTLLADTDAGCAR